MKEVAAYDQRMADFRNVEAEEENTVGLRRCDEALHSQQEDYYGALDVTIKRDSIEHLVQVFIENVVAQNKATARSFDYKAANRCVDNYLNAWNELRAKGDTGREALVSLLEDRRLEVRQMAAVVLLKYCHDKARAVLEEIAKGDSLIAFGAQQTLLNWENGNWDLDPS